MIGYPNPTRSRIAGIMTDEVTTFLNYWLYDIDRKLRSLLEPVWPDFADDDDPTFLPEEEATQVRSWLNLPAESKSREERQIELEQDFRNHGYSPAEALRKAALESRSTGRVPGRPKVLGPYAIRAFFLHLTTGKTWREITEALKGPCLKCVYFCSSCDDVRRPKPDEPSGLRPRKSKPECNKCHCTIRPKAKKERVCSWCVDAMRSAVGELEKFLLCKGLHPNQPRSEELDKLTLEQIEKAWPSPKNK